MNHIGEERLIILMLCEKALKGILSIEEFYREWPSDADKVDFLKIVRQDMEDAIQHFPASLSGLPLQKQWLRSDMYKKLFIDQAILQYSGIDSNNTDIRAKLIEEKCFAKDKIVDIIEKFKAKNQEHTQGRKSGPEIENI